MQDTGGVTVLAGIRSAPNNSTASTGFKRKESESYVLWRDDIKEKKARTGSPIVLGPAASASRGSTQTPVQLNAVGREMSRSSPLPPLAFGDPGLLKRQLQQMALLQHPTDGCARVQPSLSMPSGQPSLSSALSDGIRLPKGSALCLDPIISASGRCSSHQQQGSGAAKSKGADESSSSQNSSGFLVQQPSSKLWMEAVPMRTGTKASTSYRVYSNAFMEGRRQNGGQGSAYMRPGIPSITSPAFQGHSSVPPRLRTSAASEPAQQLSSRVRSVDAAAAARVQRELPQQQGTPRDMVRLAHAAADHVLQQRLAEQARQGDGGGPAQVEGRLPSAGSCETQVAGQLTGQQLGSQRDRSGSVGQHGRSLGTAASKNREADAASQLDQERQLAALMMIQDCAAVGAASLLSSAGAQGSSNLIYILKSLQEQSRSNPAGLLAQLQSSQESPHQQLALMRMLQDSLQLAKQTSHRPPSPDQAPQGSSRAKGSMDAVHKRQIPTYRTSEDLHFRSRSGPGREVAASPAETAPRISHEEALQRLEARAELQGKTGSGERMSRFASEPALADERSEPSGGRMRAFLSAGSPRVAVAAAPSTESPDGSDADAGRSLVFKESPTSDDRLKRLNPFNRQQAEHYSAESGRRAGWRAKGGVPSDAAPAADGRAPSLPEAKPKEEELDEAAEDAPTKEGIEREAAETLLFLTGMEREDAAADTTAVAAPEPAAAPAAEDTPTAAAGTSLTEPGGVSPLQALVQDIMQQQKQRAQVNALASLPKSVARLDVRGGGYRTGPPASDHRAGPPSGGRSVSGGHPVRADVEVPPSQPVKRKPGRPPKKRPEETPVPAAPVALLQPAHKQGSTGGLSVLGFAVPSRRRTGGGIVRNTAPRTHQNPHFGYAAVDNVTRRSSGSSGGNSDRGATGTRSGNLRGAHPVRPRRVHRPVDYDSGGEFSGGSSDARSVDSDSWDTKAAARRNRRKSRGY
ncbi:g4198 [Coccomyxa elongata]